MIRCSRIKTTMGGDPKKKASIRVIWSFFLEVTCFSPLLFSFCVGLISKKAGKKKENFWIENSNLVQWNSTCLTVIQAHTDRDDGLWWRRNETREKSQGETGRIGWPNQPRKCSNEKRKMTNELQQSHHLARIISTLDAKIDLWSLIWPVDKLSHATDAAFTGPSAANENKISYFTLHVRSSVVRAGRCTHSTPSVECNQVVGLSLWALEFDDAN